jgi:homoserine O-acetyltransferase
MTPYHAALVVFIAFVCRGARAADYPAPQEGIFVVKDFQFTSGERLADVRIHYDTFGTPRFDGAQGAGGRVSNAVLLLHSTGGSARQYVTPNFAGTLFGQGQLLDARKYFIIVPDNIGHGKSGKPSDGLHMRFPHYGYDDMIELQYRVVTQGLHVNHLRLVIGASMGGMHTWPSATTRSGTTANTRPSRPRYVRLWLCS